MFVNCDYSVSDLLNILEMMEHSDIDKLPEMDRDMVTGQGTLF